MVQHHHVLQLDLTRNWPSKNMIDSRKRLAALIPRIYQLNLALKAKILERGLSFDIRKLYHAYSSTLKWYIKEYSHQISWNPTYASESLQVYPTRTSKVQCGDRYQRYEDHMLLSRSFHKSEAEIVQGRKGSLTRQISENLKWKRMST